MQDSKLSDIWSEFASWLRREANARRIATRTVEYYSGRIKKVLNELGDQAVTTLRTIDLSRHCSTWHEIQAVQRLFNWASEMDLVSANPAAKLKKPRAGERERTLNDYELVHMLRSASRPLREYVLFCRETMCRPNEARRVSWEEFCDVTGTFALTKFKGKNRRRDHVKCRVLLLSKRARRLIDRLWRRQADPHVTPAGIILKNTRGRPWTRNAIRLGIRRVCRRTGLDRAGAEPIVAYTIRHTMATRATAKGIPDRALADILGHASTQTTQRYQHLRLAELQRFMHLVTQRSL